MKTVKNINVVEAQNAISVSDETRWKMQAATASTFLKSIPSLVSKLVDRLSLYSVRLNACHSALENASAIGVGSNTKRGKREPRVFLFFTFFETPKIYIPYKEVPK